MPRFDYAFLAENAYDDTDGRAHIRGIIETLSIPRLPSRQKKLVLMVALTADGPEKFLIRVRVTHDETGDAIGQIDLPAEVFAAGRLNLYATLDDFPVRRPGTYSFAVALENQAMPWKVLKVAVRVGPRRQTVH
jgi:hypothetical protein